MYDADPLPDHSKAGRRVARQFNGGGFTDRSLLSWMMKRPPQTRAPSKRTEPGDLQRSGTPRLADPHAR